MTAPTAPSLEGPLDSPAVVVRQFPSPSPLTIIGEHAELPLVLAIVEEITHRNRQQLKQRILDELREGRREFVFELSQCGYLDSTGLGVFMSIRNRVAEQGAKIALCGLTEELATLLELSKIASHFTITPTIAEAVAAVTAVTGATGGATC